MRGPSLPIKNRNESVVLLFRTLKFQAEPSHFEAEGSIYPERNNSISCPDKLLGPSVTLGV